MATTCCIGEHRGEVCAVRETCRLFWASEHPFPPRLRIALCPVDEHGCRTQYEATFPAPTSCSVQERRAG